MKNIFRWFHRQPEPAPTPAPQTQETIEREINELYKREQQANGKEFYNILGKRLEIVSRAEKEGVTITFDKTGRWKCT